MSEIAEQKWTPGKIKAWGRMAIIGDDWMEFNGQISPCGVFGIDLRPEGGELRVWIITHLPTGLALTGNREFPFLYEEQAKEFVRQIIPLVNWKTFAPTSPRPENFLAKIIAIQADVLKVRIP